MGERKRGDIQGLRALAVGLVMLAHIGVPGFAGGFIGVDVFFVISGFLITGLLLREGADSDRISIRGFYARRARRILPAATLVLLAVTVYSALWEPAARVRDTAEDVVWSALFLANVHFAGLGTDYFADASPSPVRHYWSLAVEEQFYLVWPVMLAALVLTRVSSRRLAVVVGALAVASLGWSLRLTEHDPVAAYFSSPARACELALGCLLAVGASWIGRLGHRQRSALGVLGLLMVLAATVTFDESTAFPGWRVLLPALGTAALLAAGTGAAPVGAGRLLALPPIRYLGDISFSLYLWHWPILLFAGQHAGADLSLSVTAGCLLLTLVLSVASYHLVEVPFQLGRVPMSRGRRALLLWPITLGTVVVTTWWAGQFGDRALVRAHQVSERYYREHPSALQPVEPRDIEAAVRRAVNLAADDAPLPHPLKNLRGLLNDIWQKEDYACYAGFEAVTSKTCAVGDVSSAKVVVLYGDSHAGMWLPAMDLLGRRDGYRVVPLVKLGCAPYDVPQTNAGKSFPSCPDFRSWAMSSIQALHPAAVVLAHRGLLYLDPPAGWSREDAWAAGVARTIGELTKLAPVVKVLSDFPHLPFSPRECLTARDASMSSCTAPDSTDETHSNTLTLAALRGTSAEYVDVTGLVCQRGRCPLVVGRIVTYRDSAHLSVTWTRTITPRVGQLLDLRLASPSAVR
jgi:peptidoglycan/LPS O-acetylase OafA/YrhL